MLVAGVIVLVVLGLIAAVTYGYRLRNGMIENPSPDLVLTRRLMLLLGSTIALIGWATVAYFRGQPLLSWSWWVSLMPFFWVGLTPFSMFFGFELATGKSLPRNELLAEWFKGSLVLCIPIVGQIGTAVLALVCLMVTLGNRQKTSPETEGA